MRWQICAVVAATSAAVSLSLAAQSKTESSLDRLAAEFQAACNRGDAEKVASFYAEDAMSMPPNRPIVRGRAAIAANLRRNLEHDPATMLLTPLESVITGTHAYEVGTRVMKWKNGLTLKEKYTRVYRRVGDDWKIAYWIRNTDSPATPPQ